MGYRWLAQAGGNVLLAYEILELMRKKYAVDNMPR